MDRKILRIAPAFPLTKSVRSFGKLYTIECAVKLRVFTVLKLSEASDGNLDKDERMPKGKLVPLRKSSRWDSRLKLSS